MWVAAAQSKWVVSEVWERYNSCVYFCTRVAVLVIELNGIRKMTETVAAVAAASERGRAGFRAASGSGEYGFPERENFLLRMRRSPRTVRGFSEQRLGPNHQLTGVQRAIYEWSTGACPAGACIILKLN